MHYLCLTAFVSVPQAPAQLAITEVLALASADELRNERPDYWELTNFGHDPIDLRGYRWGEEGIPGWADSVPLPLPAAGATIAPGESIIFFRSRLIVLDKPAFRAWWGNAIPDERQIYAWSGSPGGIDNKEGEVKLWDSNRDLVDKVTIRDAQRGVSFTYESTLGIFTNPSVADVNGAWKAPLGGDVGSPGIHLLPPVQIKVSIQPASQTVDAGSDLILKVEATSRPLPRYQWYFNDQLIQPAGVNESEIPRMICFVGCGSAWTQIPSESDLVLSKIRPEQAGVYRVRVFNGIEEWFSNPIIVNVNTNHRRIEVHCPTLACSPEMGTNLPSLTVRSGQAATFTVQFSGYPQPSFAWSFSADGVQFSPISGATSQSFTIPSTSFDHQGIYRLCLSNIVGAVVADAELKVRLPAALRFTEAMSLHCTLDGHNWWELTNVGDQPESICGYRWDDEVPLSIGQGPTITSPVILKPGESVIFLESQTPESFRQWWGESNLPPGLQFIVYSGNGLSSDGDHLYLWDPTAIDPTTSIDKVTFDAATAGVTFWFDPDSFFRINGKLSVEGDCGVFRAAESCDIGSPGWSRWSSSQFTDVRQNGPVTTLTWRAQAGSSQRLQFTRELALAGNTTNWTDLGAYTFPTVTCTVTDVVPAAEAQRFYRLVRESPADCPFPSQ